jgi:hypothetical protein
MAGPGTTFSAPSQAVNGSSVNIVAEGTSGSLDFYWAANGSAAWTREVIAGAGATTDIPAITVNAGSVNVAAVNATTSAMTFYWAANNTTTWHPQTLTGLTGGAPAITTFPGGVRVVDREWFGQLADKSTLNGTGTWAYAYVGPGGLNAPVGTTSDPAVTMNAGIENIAAIDYTGNLDFYWEDSPGHYLQEVVDTAAHL